MPTLTSPDELSKPIKKEVISMLTGMLCLRVVKRFNNIFQGHDIHLYEYDLTKQLNSKLRLLYECDKNACYDVCVYVETTYMMTLYKSGDNWVLGY